MLFSHCLYNCLRGLVSFSRTIENQRTVIFLLKRDLPKWMFDDLLHVPRPRWQLILVAEWVKIQCRTLQTQHQRPSSGLPEDSHPIEARRPSATGCHRGEPQGGPPEDRWRLATSQPTLLSPGPLLCFLLFHFSGFGLQQLTWSRHFAYSSGTGSAVGGQNHWSGTTGSTEVGQGIKE